LIRRARYILAAAGTAAVLAGGMALASAGAASAGTLPSCAGGVNCTNSIIGAGGTAGYYAADDNHTHYRFVSTVTEATPQLFLLNGTVVPGSTGVSLCDPNTGQVAQLSLFSPAPGAYEIVWAVGHFMTSVSEPCVQNGNPFAGLKFKKAGFLLLFTGITGGDHLQLQISYAPSGPNKNRLTFSACDITSNVCRQAGVSSPTRNFWESGIGAFTGFQFLTAPANNLLDSNSFNQVQCYSCGSAVPITSIAPVNPFNIGGLFEAQLVNFSTQVTMSPNDSLSEATDGFGIWNGSTSP
jgi:hypothetical protein